MNAQRINLLDFNVDGLIDWFVARGEKPFRARQIMRWIHHEGCDDFARMTNVAKNLRAQLAEEACIRPPTPVHDRIAADGTRKWLLDVGAGNAVETVFIPEKRRGTLCISTQAGCALDCAFCSTGKQGFNRNLSAAEIIGQLWLANHLLGAASTTKDPHEEEDDNGPDNGRRISNVVLMGMGEPLSNLDHVLTALHLMLDDHAYGLSRRRVTVSTSGIVPAMDRLAAACPVALAVSLHAPTDPLRNRLVPINEKYPLHQLMAACQRYLEHAPRDFITFEYVMLDGVNDQDEHARALINLVRDVPCKFNLIPFNPFPQAPFRRSPISQIRHFAAQLSDAGIITTLRKTRGEDVDAACGQLAGQIQDKTRRTHRIEPEQEPRT